jgi:hypothetical protein
VGVLLASSAGIIVFIRGGHISRTAKQRRKNNTVAPN